MRETSYDTSLSRAIVSVVTGAVTGAALVAVWYLWSAAQHLGVRYVLDYGWLTSCLVFVDAFAVWSVGITVFGLPLWWMFHTFRWRHWSVAAVVGAGTTFLVGFAVAADLFGLAPPPARSHVYAGDSIGPTVVDSHLTAHRWWMTFADTVQLGLTGMLVALVIWRMAYRRSGNARRQVTPASAP